MAYVPPDEGGEPLQQVQLEEPVQPGLPLTQTSQGMILNDGDFYSPKYSRGKSGWRIGTDGSAEFQSILLGDKTISPDSFNENKIYLRYTFESLSSWTIFEDAATSPPSIGGGACAVVAGANSTSFIHMGTNGPFIGSGEWDKNPYFQVVMQANITLNKADFGIVSGSDVFSPGNDIYGFYWKSATDKMACRYYVSSTSTIFDYDLPSYNPDQSHILRVEVDSVNSCITWYVDDIQVYKKTSIVLSPSNEILSIGLKNTAVPTGSNELFFLNLIYSQDI